MSKKNDRTVSLNPCPFCGLLPEIVIGDDEGNVHSEEGYADDPWSGLSYMLAHHDPAWDCPIALHEGETYPTLFDTAQEAAEAWNRRRGVADD